MTQTDYIIHSLLNQEAVTLDRCSIVPVSHTDKNMPILGLDYFISGSNMTHPTTVALLKIPKQSTRVFTHFCSSVEICPTTNHIQQFDFDTGVYRDLSPWVLAQYILFPNEDVIHDGIDGVNFNLNTDHLYLLKIESEFNDNAYGYDNVNPSRIELKGESVVHRPTHIKSSTCKFNDINIQTLS